MAVVVVFTSGIFLMNSQVLGMLRSSVESSASARTLHSRAEQVRSSTWSQLVTAPHYANTVFAVQPDAGGDLGGLTETILVTAHLVSPGSVTPIEVRRNANGSVTTVSPGDVQLAAQSSVRVDVTASWVGAGGRNRLRQMSLVFGEGGLSGRR